MGFGSPWFNSPEKEEARACLKIALSNGGIESMRKLIQLTQADRDYIEENFPHRLESTIGYRRRVLAEFNRLVTELSQNGAKQK